MWHLLWLLGLWHLNPAQADTAQVQLPLIQYQQLLKQTETTRVNPARYALGNAQAQLSLTEHQQQWQAQVLINFEVQVYDNEWTAIPLLPASTALLEATVNQQSVPLQQQDGQLQWASRQAGTYTLQLRYQVEVRRDQAHRILALPLPPVPTTRLQASLPLANAAVAVIPAVTVETTPQDAKDPQQTVLQATIPHTPAVQISWEVGPVQEFVISRAQYQGRQAKTVVLWQAEWQIHNFSSTAVTVPLFTADAILSEVQVDGKPAMVWVTKDKQLATSVQGQGDHRINLQFETPILKQDGPPKLLLHTPKIPLSQFALTLDGKQQLSVEPKTHIHYDTAVANPADTAQSNPPQTAARFYSPLTDQVQISWLEAIAEAELEPLRASASLYHTLYAEEGVLQGQAWVSYDITRGETNHFGLMAPTAVQINHITTPQGTLTDWRTTPDKNRDKDQQTLDLVLDRQVSGNVVFTVDYEQLFNRTESATALPLLRAVGVHRQRGMVALLSSAEWSLKPVTSERLTKVGENQLPDFVRNPLKMTVAHTYKYSEDAPLLTAQAVLPERKAGQFDVQVDTLISVGEVTLKGSASLEFNVKSGGVMALELPLPKAVNLLSLTGPSLRTYRVNAEGDSPHIEVEFTREMTGQFRLQAQYEQIMTQMGAPVFVPTLRVKQAEIEHGRIAVEALAAVEIQTAQLDNLSALELNELPRQLVLQTTHPILLAYRYVQPPYQLSLTLTRHPEREVQVALIENAAYQTLLTTDGLAITTARYHIKNSRQQFLRLQLPPQASIWSLRVGGREEKPAQAEKAPDSVLIKLINATAGFPVELVYAAKVPKLETYGEIELSLPRPDIMVTTSTWQINVPREFYYTVPHTNLTQGERYGAHPLVMPTAALELAAGELPFGLQVNIPTQGKTFYFSKLYANQGPDNAVVTLYYANTSIGYGLAAILGCGGLVWLGRALRRTWLRRRRALNQNQPIVASV